MIIIFESKTSFYSISSTETYRKNNAILKAGKTKPTIGTKIEGKKAAAITFFIKCFIYIYTTNWWSKSTKETITDERTDLEISKIRFTNSS